MVRNTISAAAGIALCAALAAEAAVLTSRNYGPCPTGTLTELVAYREYDMTGCGMEFGGHVSNDEGHFAYRQLTGDFDVIAQVTYYSPDAGYEGGVGIMARKSLASDAEFVKMKFMSPAWGDEFYFAVRTRPGGSFFVGGFTQFVGNFDNMAQPPVWIRLVRRGNTFDGAVSKNGSQWLKVSLPQFVLPGEGDADPNANRNLNWPATLYVGFAVCSDNGRLAQAKLRSVVGLDGTAVAPAEPLAVRGPEVRGATAPCDLLGRIVSSHSDLRSGGVWVWASSSVIRFRPWYEELGGRTAYHGCR